MQPSVKKKENTEKKKEKEKFSGTESKIESPNIGASGPINRLRFLPLDHNTHHASICKTPIWTVIITSICSCCFELKMLSEDDALLLQSFDPSSPIGILSWSRLAAAGRCWGLSKWDASNGE